MDIRMRMTVSGGVPSIDCNLGVKGQGMLKKM
jgi:hypothetical protein